MTNGKTPSDLHTSARVAMAEHGFDSDFPPEAEQQLAKCERRPPEILSEGKVPDLRNLLWSSIDNDTSRDLDQIEVAESLPDGATRILIGIADVDSSVRQGTP